MTDINKLEKQLDKAESKVAKMQAKVEVLAVAIRNDIGAQWSADLEQRHRVFSAQVRELEKIAEEAKQLQESLLKAKQKNKTALLGK